MTPRAALPEPDRLASMPSEIPKLAPASPTPTEALPPLPPPPLSEARPPEDSTEIQARTPLLDESLKRAEMLREETSRTVAEPTPATDDVPALPPPAARPKVEPKPEHAPAASKPAEPIVESPPLSPDERWQTTLDQLRALAGDRAVEASDAGRTWRRRARVLDWLASGADLDSAPGLSRSLWVALAETAATGEPDGRPRATALHDVARALDEQTPLAIRSLQICRKVSGFGMFEPIDATACRAGQAVIVYCEMTGLRYEPADSQVRSRLVSRAEIVSADGGKPVWTEALGTAEDICRRPRRDYYVNYRITLPKSLAPGEYELRLEQSDEIAGESVSGALPLTISP